MSGQHRGQFDLAQFILGFLEQREGIVEPPSFGVYEALIPDDLAASLGVEPYLRLSFDAPAEDALHLTVNHPLVDAIAEQLMAESANARGFINLTRMEKRGVAALAQRVFSIPNGRLKPGKGSDITARHHYLRFNFKVTYDSDEKEEEIRSVVMDVQGGYAVQDEDLLQRLESYEETSIFKSRLLARPRWLGVETPYSPEVFDELLHRAQNAAQEDMSERLQKMTARLQRFMALDIARIESYYNDLSRDLRRRRERAALEDEERARSFDEKLAALDIERANKLKDVTGRYRLDVHLELINVLMLEVPKIFAPIIISNRTVSITRHAVWNPLVHRLDPLVCDVCGKPGDRLYLCTGGHLAHQECLAPQCIDCKRVYCKLCSDQIHECAVCHQPVCQASLIRCPVCGRGSCREHQGLCHADDGKPVDLAKLTLELTPPAEAAPEPEPKPEPAPKPPPSSQTSSSRPSSPRTSGSKSSGRGKAGKKRKRRPARIGPRITHINVEVFEHMPLIRVYAMKSARKSIADCTLELTPKGISISCDCDKKAPCPGGAGFVYRPAPAHTLQSQIKSFLEQIYRDFGVAERKVTYFYSAGGSFREMQTFVLPTGWKDKILLKEARAGFDRLSG